MTLTDREKALVEAAREMDIAIHPGVEHWKALRRALRAYDNPKPVVYPIPAWAELTDEQRSRFKGRLSPVWKNCEDEMYMSIRECLALAKDSE